MKGEGGGRLRLRPSGGKTDIKDGSSSTSENMTDGERVDTVEKTTSLALVPYNPPLTTTPPPHLELIFDEKSGSVFAKDGSIELLSGSTNHVPLDLEELSSTSSGISGQSTGPYLLGDIVPNILSYCDARSLSRAACVCSEWRKISHCDDLWEHLCRTRFGVSSHELRPKPDPTKLLYILSHRRLREVCRMDAGGANPFTGGRNTMMNRSLRSLPTVAFASMIGGV